MKNNLLISFMLIIPIMLFAQEPGYYGRKTFLEIHGAGALPIFQNVFVQDKGYVFKDGALHKSFNVIDLQFRAAINRITSENAGYGFEFQQRYYAFNPLYLGVINRQFRDSNNNLISQELPLNVEHIKVVERVFMPKIILTTDGNRLPGGFFYEFGIGYTMTSIQNREPALEVDSTLGFQASDLTSKFIDERVDELKGLRFQYGFRMNYPISRQLLFTVGVRYNYSFLFRKKDYRNMEETEYWLSGREIWSRLNQRRQWGIMELGAGLVFCF
ncbi:MAG: hypothetical protein ACOVO3_12260 [Fluviicola sp.]|jgi:hypothetical protein